MPYTNIDEALNDVVYALCLKSGLDIRATDETKRELNIRTITKEQKEILNKSILDIFSKYADFKNQCCSEYTYDELIETITKDDLRKILSAYARELWTKSNNSEVEEFYNTVNMLEWHKTNSYSSFNSSVKFHKSINSQLSIDNVIENSSNNLVTMKSLSSEEFSVVKQDMMFQHGNLTFTELLNNFDTFKFAFNQALQYFRERFKVELTKKLILDNKKIQYITGQTDIEQILNSAYNFFSYHEIIVRPDFIYTTVNLGSKFKDLCTKYNLKVVTNYQLGYIAHEYLSDEQKNKANDIYFISKGSIKYISPDFTLLPQIIINDNEFANNYNITLRFIYGIAVVDPECIVSVEGKTLLNN